MLRQVDLEWYESIPDSKTKEEWLFERTACDKSLYYFICQVGAFSKDAGADIYTAPYLWKPICDFWQDDSIRRKFVFMPRKWYKSTCLTKWGSIWSYLQDPGTRILIPSQKIDLPQSFIKTMKVWVQTNSRLRYLYPVLNQIDRRWLHTHQWGATDCELPGHQGQSEPTWRAIGVTGGAQGGHYPIISPDDLISEKGMESKLILEDAKRWFDNIEELTTEFDTSLTAKSFSIIRGAGTHYAPADLGCYIQNGYPEYKWIVAPATKDTDLKDTDNIRWLQNPEVENGQSNWEVNTSTKTYLDMLSNPEKKYVFLTQHQNNPKKADEVTSFDIAWLRYYRIETIDGYKWIVCDDEDKERIRVGTFPLYGMVDPGGFSDKIVSKGGSRTAILIGGQPPGSYKKFVLHAWAGKFKDPDKFMDEIFKAHKEWNPTLWQQEIFGQQWYILGDIKKEAKARGSTLRIVDMESDEKKDAKLRRIDALAQPMANGEIYIHRSMKDLISEVSQHPGGMTMDILDILARMSELHWRRGIKPEVSTNQNIADVIGTADSSTGY